MGGFWGALAEGGVTGIFKGVGEFAKDIRAAVTGEEVLSSEQKMKLLEQAAALEASVLQADLAVIQGQVDINKIEAADPTIFKSGWRPAVGWVCVAGLAYTFVLKPILPWAVQVGCQIFGYESALPVMPDIPMGDLVILLGGLLGLGGFRTFEKFKGVSR